MSEPAKPKIVPIGKPHDRQDVIARLEKLEDSFLAGLQDIRAIKAELQKRTEQSATLEKLLDAKQVAEILREKERFVYRLAQKKQIPAIRLGKYWKFSPRRCRSGLSNRPLDWLHGTMVSLDYENQKGEKSMQATQVRIEPELHKALRIAAVEAGISMNKAINEAIEIWLKQKRKVVRK